MFWMPPFIVHRHRITNCNMLIDLQPAQRAHIVTAAELVTSRAYSNGASSAHTETIASYRIFLLIYLISIITNMAWETVLLISRFSLFIYPDIMQLSVHWSTRFIWQIERYFSCWPMCGCCPRSYRSHRYSSAGTRRPSRWNGRRRTPIPVYL